MEDDGAARAGLGQRGETAGAVRPARSRRLVVGLPQGLRLVHRDHLPDGLPARPRVLLHGLLDDRPRPAQRRAHAGQPLPAREPDAAVPGAGGRDPALGALPAGAAAPPAGRRDGTAVQVGTHLLYIGGSDGKAASDAVFVADLYSDGNFSAWRQGPELPAPRTQAGRRLLRRVRVTPSAGPMRPARRRAPSTS